MKLKKKRNQVWFKNKSENSLGKNRIRKKIKNEKDNKLYEENLNIPGD